jgi:hypothetical protein
MGYAVTPIHPWIVGGPVVVPYAGVTLSNRKLWQRIRAFEFEGGDGELPFSARLGRENGWTHARTAVAIEEYKKFIYLICVSDRPLAPSEAVDQVWHLHLIYTRSYWTSFCAGVLGRPVHHDPATGRQARAVADQYAQTRALYEREFGYAPPAGVWPSASEPSDEAPSTRTYWGCSG